MNYVQIPTKGVKVLSISEELGVLYTWLRWQVWLPFPASSCYLVSFP